MKAFIQRAAVLAILLPLLTAGTTAQGWTQLTSGTSKTLRCVFSVSTAMTIICGDDGLVLGTTNGGMVWSSANASTTENLNKIFVSGLTLPTITVAGDNGVLRASTNVGVTWNTLTSGTGEDINDLFCHDPTVGTTFTAVGDNGVILFSNNGGATWGLKLAPTNDRLNGVFFTDLLNGVIVGNSGVVLRTTNGGAAWSSITSGTSADLNHVFFTTASDGWAAGAGGLLMNTTDGGQSWASVTSPTSFDLRRLSFSDANNGTAVGSRGTIIRTSDAGSTWHTQNSGVLTELHSVFFVDANNGMVVGNSGLILQTTNGGWPVELLSFSATRMADHAVQLRWSTATETANFGFEVQREAAGGVWTTIGFVAGAGNSTARKDYLYTDEQAPSERSLAYRLRQVDLDGGEDYSPVIHVEHAGIAPALPELAAWPQPLRGSGQLRLQLPQDGHAVVQIYNLSGAHVVTLAEGTLTAGTHILRWNGRAVPAGMYMAVLRFDGITLRQRLIVEH